MTFYPTQWTEVWITMQLFIIWLLSLTTGCIQLVSYSNISLYNTLKHKANGEMYFSHNQQLVVIIALLHTSQKPVANSFQVRQFQVSKTYTYSKIMFLSETTVK